MNITLSSFRRAAGLVTGALLACPLVPASEPVKSKDTDAFPAFENYIKFSAMGESLSGAKPAFQARTQKSKTGSAGIEDFFYGYDINKETAMELTGKALPGAEDYLLQVKLTKQEVGSFDAGYKRFRTFYDGAGGFFPINNAWLPLYPRALYVDRGQFYINATVALPKQPVFTFKYTNTTRNGRKDSTIWGDTDQTGVPILSLSSLNVISANRKIVPAYLQIGERQEIWEASVRQTMGKTTAVFTLTGNRINNLNMRSIDRYPGEVKPFPAIPSNPVTVVAPTLANNANKGFDQQGFKETGLTVGGKVETVVSDQVTAYVAGNYRHSSEDVAATRLVQGYLATATGVISPVGSFTSGGRPPYSYTSTGDLKMHIWTGSVGLQTRFWKDLRADFAVKAEDQRVTGDNAAVYVNNLVVPATGVVTQQLVPATNHSSIAEKPWTPQVDLRYTGIKNVAFFLLWDRRSLSQDERKSYTGISTSAALILTARTISTEKVSEKHSNLKVGANWNVSPMLTLRGEFFTKDHENSFTGYDSSLGGYYIFDYDTYGVRVSAALRPHPTVAFTTRYLALRGRGAVSEDGFVEGDSNDTRRYEVGESIDWVPNKNVYLQLNGNVVFDKTSTAYPRFGGAANDVLHNADNNFWNSSFVTGFVLTHWTDAQVQATYYKANNYNRALAVATDPYGQGVRDYSLTVGVKHKFSDRMVGSAKIGYLNSNSETTGGFANYKGAIGYVSFSYGL
jgi:hypothetical protein